MALTKDPIPMTWLHEITGWTNFLITADRAKTTIELRERHLRWVAKAFRDTPPHLLQGQELLDWLASKEWMTETRRGVHQSLKSFYAWALKSNLVPVDLGLELPVVKPASPKPRPIPDNLLTEALSSATHREWLILVLACDHGLRRSEICQVNPARDLRLGPTGWTLTVHGKGGVDRQVPMESDFAKVLMNTARPNASGWLFPGRQNGHLSPRYVGKLATQVLPGDWTLHSLRHRFGTTVFHRTKDIVVTQELLGHRNLNTTRTYVAGSDIDRRNAVKISSVRRPAPYLQSLNMPA